MPETICHKFLDTAKKHSDRTAVMYRRGDRWSELDWNGYRENVETIAAGLQVIGVRHGDKVAVLSDSRFEWAAIDLATLGLGAIVVPIYPSSSPEDISFILSDSEAKVFIGENGKLLHKLRDVLSHAKTVDHVISIDPLGDHESELHPKVSTLEEIQSRGDAALKKSPTLYELAIREISLNDLATIVYTSGTTGRPKGVELTHTQVLSEVSDAFPLLGVTSRDRSLTFLPFAHVLGRIEIWGHALIGYTMAFAQSVEKLKDDLIEVKPSLIVSVPRVFEKIHNGIISQAEVGRINKKVFNWALDVGREISIHKIEKKAPPLDLALRYQLARQLVFNKIAEKLGGNLRFAVCGGAPLSRSIAEFFHSAGILILEGYGLTETTAAICVNTPFDYRFGTVGRPIGDVKIKIAEDGEILIQSKKVMKGYHNDPESTDQVLKDGWLYTGDIGEISGEGYLSITDRKKDLIKTAGGKYVAPQKLEGLLKASRFISQVHIHGDQRKYVVALLTLNMDSIRKFAQENGIGNQGMEVLIEDAKVKNLIRSAVAEANTHLASFESIKNFALLPNEFTIESGELTPSLKIKRKVVDQRYRDLIEKLYK